MSETQEQQSTKTDQKDPIPTQDGLKVYFFIEDAYEPTQINHVC